MNKEEILKRSRSEKDDEGILFVLNKGSLFGTRIFLLIIISLIIFSLVMLRTVDLALLLTILWGYLAGIFIGFSKAENQKRVGLITVSILVTIMCFALYINQVLF
ncbi:MAG: DUF6442 family protein [Coprobacillus sp.]